METEWSPRVIALTTRFNEAFLEAAIAVAIETEEPASVQPKRLRWCTSDHTEFNEAMKAIAATAIEAGCLEVLKLAAKKGLEVVGS